MNNTNMTESESMLARSTYGLVTAGRIFESYNIHLDHEDLLSVMKTPESFYYRLIRMPLKNVFNGIILQQVQDYQNFAQKLYVDYLLSGEGGKPDTSPGAATRAEIEERRQQLIQSGEDFGAQKHQHEKLISKSQTLLIADAQKWNQQLKNIAKHTLQVLSNEGFESNNKAVLQALTDILVQYDFKSKPELNTEQPWKRAENALETTLPENLRMVFVEQLDKLAEFHESSNMDKESIMAKIDECSQQLKQYRRKFREIIIDVKGLLGQLPDYKMDMLQIENNLGELQFDPQLGEM